jgi:DNA-binding Xre family transcriptional regulator
MFLLSITIFLAKGYVFCRKIAICAHIYNKVRDMETKDLNRIKVVLADKKRTNKWLAEQLGKDPATVSKWCTNSAQPNLENLMDIAKCLEVDLNELVRM